jgi:hypothetical protein
MQSAEQKKLMENVEELKLALISNLGLVSIEAGVGVDDKMVTTSPHTLYRVLVDSSPYLCLILIDLN